MSSDVEKMGRFTTWIEGSTLVVAWGKREVRREYSTLYSARAARNEFMEALDDIKQDGWDRAEEERRYNEGR